MTIHSANHNISGLRVNHHSIVEQHLSQNYGELQCDMLIDKVKQKYQLFPNEALYVIDCKYAQLEPLSDNFCEIVQHDGHHHNDISLLYTHVDQKNYDALVRWVEAMLDGMFGQWSEFQPEIDVVSCLYLSRDGKVILKSTTPLIFDSNGVMRYSLGKLTNLSGIVPFPHFNYRFEGPNRQKALEFYHQKIESYNILSPRETEILQLIGTGLSSEQIGKQLSISRLTVDKHRRNIIDKLDTTSAIEAFNLCKNAGFF